MADYKKKRCKYLIAMGCLVQRYCEELAKALPEVDLWIKLDEYNHLWSYLNQTVKEQQIQEVLAEQKEKS